MTNTTPAQVTRRQFIEFTRTNGSYGAGFVLYNRGGVIKFASAYGQIRIWINHSDIAEISAC